MNLQCGSSGLYLFNYVDVKIKQKITSDDKKITDKLLNIHDFSAIIKATI